MNCDQGSYTASNSVRIEGIRLGTCGWKVMNSFVVNSIIPFSVFPISSNSLSVLSYPLFLEVGCPQIHLSNP